MSKFVVVKPCIKAKWASPNGPKSSGPCSLFCSRGAAMLADFSGMLALDYSKYFLAFTFKRVVFEWVKYVIKNEIRAQPIEIDRNTDSKSAIYWARLKPEKCCIKGWNGCRDVTSVLYSVKRKSLHTGYMVYHRIYTFHYCRPHYRSLTMEFISH